ncbi:amidohydrolase family protein [Clostridium sporogenes]|uniref:amidohydrolase family protein n=1 Tax=Clostridium sporogenes TaxID=1509 RepID=UPI0022387CF9|nr:TatD family hydrolase [Clostridium sporogenes]MCW6060566.1 amidohydrolase family protein [Clostridium sporogenes]MCW6067559.1 amidohydrolase family protein [Clostridium sporogenes]
MITKQEFVKKEKYLKLNDNGDFIIDYNDKLQIIDFHTHMCNLLPLKATDPKTKGKILKYKTLPNIENMDLSVPYWCKINPNEKKKGVISILKFSIDGYKILKDMGNGGTYENCFKSQRENMVKKNVLLPLSTKKHDLSMEALRVAKEYPDKFIPFCSVHPSDPKMKKKILRYKNLGAKGLKLKVTDMEFKNDFKPLIEIFKVCHELGLPVILHTGSLTHIKRENTSNLMWKLLKSTRVEFFGELLNRLPSNFKFVFGHSGIEEYKLVAKYLKKFPSSYAELSSQSTESIKSLIDEVGYERLLYGSDWPALPQAITLSRVLQATEKNEDARDSILFKNAEKLLDI